MRSFITIFEIERFKKNLIKEKKKEGSKHINQMIIDFIKENILSEEQYKTVIMLKDS